MDRYNQVVELLNETQPVLVTAHVGGKEVARQWFKIKRDMVNNGQLDASVLSAYMKLVGSSNGGFLPVEKINRNVQDFAVGYHMCESQRVKRGNEQKVRDSVYEILQRMMRFGMINHNARAAIEKVYGINSKARAHA